MKDLINQLQEKYSFYTDEIKSVFGEPEIMIDVFKEAETGGHYFTYVGWSPDFSIDKSSDGVYDIISKFENEKPKIKPLSAEAEKSYYQVWPFPEGGEASYNGPEKETG